MFRAFGDRRTTSRQAGRKSVSRLGEGEAKKKIKKYQRLKTLQSHVTAGIRLIALAPIGSGSLGEGAQGGRRNKFKEKQARPPNAMRSMPMQSKHWTMSWMDGPGWPTPFPNCHPSSGRSGTKLYHSTRAAGAAPMVCTLMVLRQDEDPKCCRSHGRPEGNPEPRPDCTRLATQHFEATSAAALAESGNWQISLQNRNSRQPGGRLGFVNRGQGAGCRRPPSRCQPGKAGRPGRVVTRPTIRIRILKASVRAANLHALRLNPFDGEARPACDLHAQPASQARRTDTGDGGGSSGDGLWR